MQYKFDKFTIDADNLCLLVGQGVVSVEPRMLRLLILLAEAYPAHCEQQFLLDNVWQRTVVSYWSLARLVSDTRRFFKQHGYPTTVIETVHGSGFRLSATLSLQAIAVDYKKTATPNSPKSIRRLMLSSSVIVLLLLAGVAVVQQFNINPATVEPTARALTIGEPIAARGRVLWVDDHPDNNMAEIDFLRQHQIGVYTVANSEEALTLLKLYRYDAIISDMGRNGDPLAGLKLLQQLKEEQNDIPFFFYTIMLSDTKQQLLHLHGATGAAETSPELYQQLSTIFSELTAPTDKNQKQTQPID